MLILLSSLKNKNILYILLNQVLMLFQRKNLIIKYKVSPDQAKGIQLKARLCEIFTQKTDYQMLNLALERLYKNMDELLMVLERPEIPLHNNLSENDIREYVKRRKVSGSTRSELKKPVRVAFTEHGW